MATLAQGGRPNPVARERAFFFYMALAVAATTVTGFSVHLAMGLSTFASPWWVHAHAFTFMGWMGLWVLQNWLVWRGRVNLHRRVGPLAAVYAGWMVVIGIGATMLSVAAHRIPPFFELNVFLVMDWTIVLVFAGLTWAAVRLRARSDWHRRLMLCGTIQVMAPGLARLLPLPLVGTWMVWLIWAALGVFVAVAMFYDLATRGKVHPAYFWGFGAITLGTALMRPIAFTAPMLALTARLTG